jgi:hypothetical protein
VLKVFNLPAKIQQLFQITKTFFSSYATYCLILTSNRKKKNKKRKNYEENGIIDGDRNHGSDVM